MLPRLRPEATADFTAPVSIAPEELMPQRHSAIVAVERAAARTLGRYLQWTASRSRLAYMDESGRCLDVPTADSLIRSIMASGQPLIVTYWIADALAVALLPLVDDAFADLMASVTCVIDDTFAGRIAGRYIEEIAGRSMMLALPGDLERLRQVQALMRARASCAFPVDGGGPYRTVGTGIVTLATTLRAAILPLAAFTHRAFPPIHRSKVRLPTLSPDLHVAIGRPIVPAAHEDRRVEAARVAASLNALHDHVRGMTDGRSFIRRSK
jgi:lysophospholipid acyltransferase (LPLAT)-like uncharacterized protein